MHNWSADETRIKKDKEKYAIWKLEQMVNFGLGGEKLKQKELLKHWDKLHIDPARKKLLRLFLYGTENSY